MMQLSVSTEEKAPCVPAAGPTKNQEAAFIIISALIGRLDNRVDFFLPFPVLENNSQARFFISAAASRLFEASHEEKPPVCSHPKERRSLVPLLPAFHLHSPPMSDAVHTRSHTSPGIPSLGRFMFPGSICGLMVFTVGSPITAQHVGASDGLIK